MRCLSLLFLTSLYCRSKAVSCYNCASASLKDNWALTGLPAKPPSLVFTDECKVAPGGDSVKDATCPENTPCIEMIIPTFDNQLEVVRGCYNHFFPSQDSILYTGATVDKALCYHMNLTTAHITGYNAVRLCVTKKVDPPTPEIICNNHLIAGIRLTQDECTMPQTTGCYQCQYYDGRGGCSPTSEKETFQGPSCIKIRGTLGGHDYEERAVSYITPFDVAKMTSCISISGQNHTLSYGTAAGTAVARSKRDIVKRAASPVFNGDMCYCTNGDGCNGSPMMSGLPAVILLTMTVVPFFS